MPNPIKKILVVDDEAAIRQGVTELLVELGYRVLAAPDGEQARTILAADWGISLVITDFRMPKLDGVELLNWCRAEGMHMPVVLMSADRHLLPREKLALCDCCALLLYKPFNVDMLVSFLSAVEKLDHAACVADTALGHDGSPGGSAKHVC